ncbi:MAG: hypothetical protein ACRDNG_03075 [Gaiellaceae bacterium]
MTTMTEKELEATEARLDAIVERLEKLESALQASEEFGDKLDDLAARIESSLGKDWAA